MIVLPAPGSSANKKRRLSRQHCFVNRSDLMGERIDKRRVDSKYRIKKMGEPNALRLRTSLIADVTERIFVRQFECL
jgi:hypothetical protein